MIQADPLTLKAAFAKAAPGETIELTPGDYGQISLKNKAADAPITLRAMEGADIAGVMLRSCAGLNFEGFQIQSRTTGADIFRSDNGERIRFVDGSIRGTSDRTARGAVLKGPRTEILRSRFHDLERGAIVSWADCGEISDCIFRGLASDGIDIGETHGLNILRNTFSDFTPTLAAKGGQGHHPDAIQLILAYLGVRTIAAIRIIENVIFGETQGICGFKGERSGIEDTEITDNLICVSAPHKITLTGSTGEKISGNIIPRWPGHDKPANIVVNGTVANEGNLLG